MARHSSPQDWFWMRQFEAPPTTTEWLAWCRQNGIEKCYFGRGRVLHRPYRAFISPSIRPWGAFTGDSSRFRTHVFRERALWGNP